MKSNMRNNAGGLVALAASASAIATSSAGAQIGCYWKVPNVGAFNTRFQHDWVLNLAANLNVVGSSLYTVAAVTSPLSRAFSASNVGTSLLDSAMTLTVPGGQTASE